MQLKDVVRAFDSEKDHLMQIIRELEERNRALSQKLSMKIYNAADSYKQKTLSALK
jgi:hypothetical protein